MSVKGFMADNNHLLETAINAWLGAMRADVVDIAYSVDQYGNHCALVVYVAPQTNSIVPGR